MTIYSYGVSGGTFSLVQVIPATSSLTYTVGSTICFLLSQRRCKRRSDLLRYGTYRHRSWNRNHYLSASPVVDKYWRCCGRFFVPIGRML